MKPVLRGTDGRRSCLWGGSSLSLLICPSLLSHTSSAVSLSLHHNLSLSMDIHESTDWTSHPAEINGGVRSSERPRGWTQAFTSICYCQRGADLFSSSRSSVRQVLSPPICGFGYCRFMHPLVNPLFSSGEDHSPVCPCWKKKKKRICSGGVTFSHFAAVCV